MNNSSNHYIYNKKFYWSKIKLYFCKQSNIIMLVISARELTQNKNKFFDMANKQRVIIKRKNRFFQIVDLGEMIPELNDTYMTEKEMLAKIDEGIAEYKAGKTKILSSKEEIHSFLNSL